MITARNSMRNQVAVAGAATTGFVARNTKRSQASLVAEACIKVLRQCGLSASDVDGICGSSPAAPAVQSMLGIPEVTWFANPVIPFVNQVAAAASAVYAGLCDVALVYHAAYRLPWNTLSSLHDPFRRTAGSGSQPHFAGPETVAAAVGYAAWASRYLYEYGVGKDAFGYVAINDRTNARRNPAAALRDPITMDDYRKARMVRWPLCLLDMDVPVDGADALVITTTERARDLPLTPVLLNAVALGVSGKNAEDQIPDLLHHGQQIVVRALRAKSDFWIEDCDVYYPYDGFSIIALNWIENAGWCCPGEAGAFLEDHWLDDEQRILIKGRIPVNSHGGALSEGGTQGSGHVREAVHQLQGLADGRQVVGAERAIVTAGGFFFNAQGLTLQRDGS
jgi:acetyl-CoA acetyltransferase